MINPIQFDINRRSEMSDKELPVKSTDEFIADLETMDLSELKNKTFLVAVSQGDRNKHRFLSSTVRGPYTFEEMCDEVGNMWYEFQHHAKAVICEKDRTKPVKTLDENTIDYIEANYKEIIIESMLGGVFDSEKTYTCKAGIVDADLSEEPKKIETISSEEEDV
jgi:hypothetical protein